MRRKYASAADMAQKSNNPHAGPAYVNLDPFDAGSMSKYTEAITSQEMVARGLDNVGGYRDYSDLASRISGMPGLTDSDFAKFRPFFERPTKPADIIKFARHSYATIGLIHNAIDLMGDFAVQGIRFVHPNPTIEKFYRGWFKQVNGKQVSERIAHLLFREANVVVRFYTAKLNKAKQKEWRRTIGAADLKPIKDKELILTPLKGEVPWRYTFIDPTAVSVVGDSAGNLADVTLYKLNVSQKTLQDLRSLMRLSDDPTVKKILDRIPEDLKKIVEQGSSNKASIILPPNKTVVLHYKKDTWQQWAHPMVYAAFDDLVLYQKLKLADRAALDGAVQKIRVWKLGSLDHNLAPSPVASSALSDMIAANTGGGTKDLIWGPDIELIETGTDVHRFLGEEKYKPTLMSIYATLGIPPTLTGTFGATGTTNNFISLKTLIERLNYVREILVGFWAEQARYVQMAMGFARPPVIEFDMMYLDDPASMLSLLKDLADRNIVSDEFVQRYVKAVPELEAARVTKENKRRAKNQMDKVSPYHVVDKKFNLERIALQTGMVTPSEVGLVLLPRKDGEINRIEMLSNMKELKTRKSPSDGGRPPGVKDKEPRKKAPFKPIQKAHVKLWADDMQEKIAEVVTPIILKSYGKSSARELTQNEFDALEKLKFEILCSLKVGDSIEDIQPSELRNTKLHEDFEKWLPDRKLTVSEIRDLRSLYYSEVIYDK